MHSGAAWRGRRGVMAGKCHRLRIQREHAADTAPRSKRARPAVRTPAQGPAAAARCRGGTPARGPRLRAALRRRARGDDTARAPAARRRSGPDRRAGAVRGGRPGSAGCRAGPGCRGLARPVRAGARRDPGRITAAAPDHALDDRAGPAAYQEARPDAGRRAAAAGTPGSDLQPGRRCRGDDGCRRFRPDGPRAGGTTRAKRIAARQSRTRRQARAVALYRRRGRLTRRPAGRARPGPGRAWPAAGGQARRRR